MASALLKAELQTSPLDLVERLAADRGWPMDRQVADEITIEISGRWSDYSLSLSWDDMLETLQAVAAYDFKVPPMRRDEVVRLIARINEQMWAGHFDLWSEGNLLMCRGYLLLNGGASANRAQCEGLMQITLDACERYFPAFQFAIWAGKTAEEALEAAMIETAGEA